jgi:lipopolysaccharide transport system ATP-binding protein
MLPAISVQNLGKMYRLSHQFQPNDSLREVIASALLGPFKRLRQLSGKDETMEEFWALKDVSFDVQQGDVVGIIGRNGAGKSTLLKILSRIVDPTEGEARIRGRVASLLEVGTGFHPDLTGRENIFLNGSILGMSKAEVRLKFDEIVNFAEVEKFLDTPVKRYSSGMYVRLAFAVAAHLDPEILIVDEVLSVGDAEFQKKCLGKMTELTTGTGRTVLFISHNMAAVQRLCASAIVLKEGRVEFMGDVEAAAARYFAPKSLPHNGYFDLSDHSGRLAASQKLFKTMQTFSDGTPTSTFLPNGSVDFQITVELPERVNQPRLNLFIDDMQSRRIMTLSSSFKSPKLPPITGRHTICCRTSPLKLGPGRYIVGLRFADRGRGRLDGIDTAGWIDVEWDNSYDSGEPYLQGYGPVLNDCQWSITDHSA